MNSPRLTDSIRIVGAGLLGTSIGLALSKLGLDVVIADASPANQKLAIDCNLLGLDWKGMLF